MSHPFRFITATSILTLSLHTSAQAQSDREVYEYAIDRAAGVCPEYSKNSTTAVIRTVPVGALRVLQQRGFVICPNPRLATKTPAVWYGDVGVFVWNPQVEDAGKVLVGKIDAMTRSEEFPVQTLVWDTTGTTLEEQTVPAFEARPGAFLRSQSR